MIGNESFYVDQISIFEKNNIRNHKKNLTYATFRTLSHIV